MFAFYNHHWHLVTGGSELMFPQIISKLQSRNIHAWKEWTFEKKSQTLPLEKSDRKLHLGSHQKKASPFPFTVFGFILISFFGLYLLFQTDFHSLADWRVLAKDSRIWLKCSRFWMISGATFQARGELPGKFMFSCMLLFSQEYFMTACSHRLEFLGGQNVSKDLNSAFHNNVKQIPQSNSLMVPCENLIQKNCHLQIATDYHLETQMLRNSAISNSRRTADFKWPVGQSTICSSELLFPCTG